MYNFFTISPKTNQVGSFILRLTKRLFMCIGMLGMSRIIISPPTTDMSTIAKVPPTSFAVGASTGGHSIRTTLLLTLTSSSGMLTSYTDIVVLSVAEVTVANCGLLTSFPVLLNVLSEYIYIYKELEV